MRKLLLLLFVAVTFASCNSNSPESTAKKFSESMAKGDMEEAKKYLTPGTASLFDMAVKMSGTTMPTYPDFKFKMIKDSIVGDTLAWVTYLSPENKEEQLALVKENNEWKVTMGK